MGRIGRNARGGLDRTAYSDAHLEACATFRAWATEAGADVRADGVGNVIARFGDEGPQPVVVGSHLDTVPNGGRFDGALGVLAGLEAAQALAEGGCTFERPIYVIAFADEEGAHGAGTVGSRAMCVGLSDRDLAMRKGPGQPSLQESLERAGLDPSSARDATPFVETWSSFIEVHPEQGGVLEAGGLALAIVTGIVSSARLRVQVPGKANHAGTTPMAMRDDALVKTSGFVTKLDAYARGHAGALVATVGRLDVVPNTVNVIPGAVDLTVDVRAPHDEEVDAAIDWVEAQVAELEGTVDRTIRKLGAAMSEDVMADLQSAAVSVTDRWTHLPSGAGHDARTIANAGVPTGMLFVPSRGGVSHSPAEFTSEQDCVTATRVLAQYLLARVGTSDRKAP